MLRLAIVSVVAISGMAVANFDSRASAATASTFPVGTLAWAAATARETGTPVVVDALTTQTDQFICNPDGSETNTTAARPVRVKKNGSWQPLSAALGQNADGTYSPAATLGALALSGGGTATAVNLSGVPLSAGNNLSLSWPAVLPTPSVVGDTATYPSALPGVDLVLRATADGGFNQVVVVKDAPAAASPALAQLQLGLSAPGLSVQGDASGNLAATDASGANIFLAPAPLMWDSTSATDLTGAMQTQAQLAVSTGQARASSSAQQAGAAAVISPVGATVAGSTLTLIPPATQLVGPTVHYPLFIDQNWTSVSTPRQHWTYVNSNYNTTNYFDAADEARLGDQGWTSPYFTARSFYLFTIPTQIWGTHVMAATLQTNETWSASGTAYQINVNHISTSPTAISSATTWNNQPVKGPQVASTNAAGNWSSAGESGVTPKEIDFDVTGEIISAASGHWSYDTLGLYNSTETDRNAWRKFQNNPTLSITYNTIPNAPTYVNISPIPWPGTDVGNWDVTFNASGTDPAGTQNPLTLTFTITDITANTTTTVIQTVTSGQFTSFTEPASFFTNQHSYSWSVQASDGIDTGPATAGPSFKVSYLPLLPWQAVSGSFVSSGVSATIAGANTYVFWRGTDGNLWGSVNNRTAQNFGMGILGGAPQAVGQPSGIVDVFWRGGDNRIWHAFINPAAGATTWQGPTNLLGSSSLTVAPETDPWAVTTSTGTLDVFYRGSNNGLDHVWYATAGGWQSPEQLPFGTPVAGQPRAVGQSDGTVDVFFQNSSSHIIHAFYLTGTGWRGAYDMTGSSTASYATASSAPFPVVTSNGTIDVFYKGQNSDLSHIYYIRSSGWHGPDDLGMGPLGGAPYAVGQSNSNVDVFWRGADNGVWRASYRGGWTGPVSMAGSITGDPFASAYGGLINVVANQNGSLTYNATS